MAVKKRPGGTQYRKARTTVQKALKRIGRRKSAGGAGG